MYKSKGRYRNRSHAKSQSTIYEVHKSVKGKEGDTKPKRVIKEEIKKKIRAMLEYKDLELVDSDLKPTNDFSNATWGSFAVVLRTRTKTGDVRAAKTIAVETFQKKRDWRDAVREMSETTSLNHSSIVKFYDPVSFSLYPHELNSLSYSQT